MALCVLMPWIVFAQVGLNSGHHYSSVQGARIGHDFGRNPWTGSSESFSTFRGRSRLRRALQQAIGAGETRLSFDFGFDFRSIVVVENPQNIRLDDFVLPSVEAFLEEVEAADASAQEGGGRFHVDVVLTDYRMADRVDREGSPPVAIGEHPELITDETAKLHLLDALSPVFKRLGQHPLVTLVLMNEPEFIALPVAKAVASIRRGKWGEISLVQNGSAGKPVILNKSQVLSALAQIEADCHFAVQEQPRTGKVTLVQTGITEGIVDQFLVDLHRAILQATTSVLVSDFDGNGEVDFDNFLRFASQFSTTDAFSNWDSAFDLKQNGEVDFEDFLLFVSDFGKRAVSDVKVTVGWSDDQSALEGTRRLEVAAGQVVTPVISFHVYGVPENFFHPLTKTRADFDQADFSDRSIRITEWGLGGLSGSDRIQRDMVDAFQWVEQADMEGILFWWDDVHVFEHAAYRQAVGMFQE